MKNQNNPGQNKKALLIMLGVLIINSNLFAQPDMLTNESDTGLDFMVGISVSNLPVKIVEEEISVMPKLEFFVNYDLGSGFEIGAGFNTVYITNEFTAKLSKSIPMGQMLFKVNAKVNYWLGASNFDGFDVNCRGLENEVTFEVDVPFNDHLLTFKTGPVFNQGRDIRVGSASYSKANNSMSGMTYEIDYTEKVGDVDLILGLRVNHVSSSNNTWIAFSSCNQRLFTPSLFLGVRL